MDHQDHIHLIEGGIKGNGGSWADVGSGSGAFTLALAEILGPKGIIYSIDKNKNSLIRQREIIEARFSTVNLLTFHANFAGYLDFLPPLDGIIMANSLHFIRDKLPVLRNLKECLKENGPFILVEYDTSQGNLWVPHPLSFQSWLLIAAEVGFSHTELLATKPSSFLGSFYSAISY